MLGLVGLSSSFTIKGDEDERGEMGGFEVVIQPAKFRNKAGQDQVCQP